jgi:hypothetical protein
MTAMLASPLDSENEKFSIAALGVTLSDGFADWAGAGTVWLVGTPNRGYRPAHELVFGV